MIKTFIFLLTVFFIAACNNENKSKDNKTIGLNSNKNKTSANNLTLNKIPDCSIFYFKSLNEQADTLTKYYNIKQVLAEEKFFCAFPNSFKEMQAIFGFQDENLIAPLYEYPKGEKMINYFSNLNSINKGIYYDKYINICIDGFWEADNIREAFGFANRILNDTEVVCSSLSKRTDKEIKSVFNFIFDGPHPKNEYNEKKYNNLIEKLTKRDKRLSNLLKESYNSIINQGDRHTH